MQQIIIDGKSVRTRLDFHMLISKTFGFPAHYGKNLDAMWDCLTEYVPDDTTLIWNNHQDSKDALGDYFNSIVGGLQEARG